MLELFLRGLFTVLLFMKSMLIVYVFSIELYSMYVVDFLCILCSGTFHYNALKCKTFRP